MEPSSAQGTIFTDLTFVLNQEVLIAVHLFQMRKNKGLIFTNDALDSRQEHSTSSNKQCIGAVDFVQSSRNLILANNIFKAFPIYGRVYSQAHCLTELQQNYDQ